MNESPENEIISIIRRHQRFLLGCHLHPDGDAIGSVLALGLSLSAMGKEVQMICPEGVPTVYRFLEGSDRMKKEMTASFSPEVVIALDCAERARLSLPEWPVSALLVNIDHHISNSGFGHVSLVRPEASATGEIIYDLLAEFGMPMPNSVATAIYTAIATDTGFFRFNNTSGKVLRNAATLVEEFDVSPSHISEHVHDEKSFSSLRLLAEVLGTLTLEENGRVAWLALSNEMVQRYQLELEETEGFVNYARSVSGVELGIFFKELAPGEVKVSLRSGPAIDVSKVAAEFGGGGHARASGCTIHGTLDEAVEKLLSYIRDVFHS